MIKRSFKKYMTENGPEVVEKNFFIEGEEDPTLQYVIKNEGKAYIIRVHLNVKEDKQIEVIDNPSKRTQIFYLKTTKDVKSTKDTSYKTVVNLGYLNYTFKKGIASGQNYDRYNLRPVIDLFFKIVPTAVREYNTDIIFASDKEAKDVFGDLFNEI
jgi:hypothetical protein